MNGADYIMIRRRWLRGGEPDDALWAEMRRVVAVMVRRRALPPAYAPYGVWNQEAEEDVFQNWARDRLVGDGQLKALVAKSPSLSSLRAVAEISLRQHLLNARERTHAQNLYARLGELLKTDPGFRRFIDAAQVKDRWWGLAEWDQPVAFKGDERMLLAAAWSVGSLTVVRYRADARKLSPVLDATELRRFAVGALESLGELLRIGLLVRALQLRMDLDPPTPRSLEDSPEPIDGASGAATGIVLRETALQVIGEMTRRQVEILIGTDSGDTLETMAGRLACSRVTVFNEQERMGSILDRFSANVGERDELLKTLLEVLYKGLVDA